MKAGEESFSRPEPLDLSWMVSLMCTHDALYDINRALQIPGLTTLVAALPSKAQ